MNVLFVSPRQIWPVHGGANLRDYHLARYLARRCSLTYLEMRSPEAAGDPPGPDLGFEVLSVVKDRPYTPGKIIRGLAGPKPLPVLNYDSPRIAQFLRRLLAERRFDTVQVENSHLSSYISDVANMPNRPAIVADWHNIESNLWFRYAGNARFGPKKWASQRTGTLVRNVESELLDICDAHTVVSDLERTELADRAPDAEIEVIANGVDTGYYAEAAAVRCPSTPPRFLFVGAMDYRPNVDGIRWFARDIWPRFVARRPGARLIVAGRSPVPAVEELASDNIEILGRVDDLRPHYAAATAAVVPLRIGAGTRLKILEAMAAGAPVISTAIGAEGIEAQDGRHFLCANTERDFVAAMDRVADDPIVGRALTASGSTVARTYDWSSIAEPLFRLHERLAKTRSGRREPALALAAAG